MFQRQIGFLVCFCLVCSLFCCSAVLAEEQAVDFLDPILIVSAETYSEAETEILNELLWQEGFFAIIKVVPENTRPEQIRRIVKEFGKKEKGFSYVMIDENLATGEIEETKTDYYFTDMSPFISASRYSREDLLRSLLKKPNEEEQIIFASPILTLFRLIYGCCRVRKLIDPSQMGWEIYRKYPKIITLFEQEGIEKSNRKPTLALNKNNFETVFGKASVVFALTTYEPVGQMLKDFGPYPLTIRKTLDRAIWLKDNNNNGYVTDDEMKVENYFDFFEMTSVEKRKVGIFPQLLEEDIRQELFSSFLCSSDAFGTFVHTGDQGNGSDRGVLFVWRHFLEEFLQGKTLGQAWARMPGLIDERFPLEGKMMDQTKDFLKLRVKGLPFVKIHNIDVSMAEEIDPGQKLIIKNRGEIPIRFQVEKNYRVVPDIEKGIILSNEEIKISFSTKTRLYKLFATEPSRKKFIFIRIWFNNAISKKVKVWYYQ